MKQHVALKLLRGRKWMYLHSGSCNAGGRLRLDRSVNAPRQLTNPSGEWMRQVFSALALFERRLIQERTRAARASAPARGGLGGWPPIDFDEAKLRAARRLHGDHSDADGAMWLFRRSYLLVLGLCAQDVVPRNRMRKVDPQHGNLSRYDLHGRSNVILARLTAAAT
jgi:hypothetical protein